MNLYRALISFGLQKRKILRLYKAEPLKTGQYIYRALIMAFPTAL